MQVQLKKQHSRYSKYKHTGISWLGAVPEGWEVRKMLWNAKKIGSGTTPQAGNEAFYENGEISWIITGDLNDGLLKESSKKITRKAFLEHSALKIYPKNSVVIAMYGATIGKLAITEFDACTNQACCVIQANEKMSSEFCFYWLLGNKQNIINLSYGGGQPNINQEIVKSLRIPTPSRVEQTAIVNHLKEKTGLIERIIEAKQRQIELLKEKRSALINRAVTKGIRTKVMFDTNAFDQWQKLQKKQQDQLLERVEIIYTHIQEDELPSDLRGVLPSAKKVSTSGAIFDISRYDHCTYGGDEDSSNISAVVGSGKKENHNKDALIANTSKMQKYLLITDDQRLQKKCSEIGGEVLPFKEFIDRFEMKDSGEDWIGNIPTKWWIERLKFVSPVRNKKTADASPELQYIALENVESWTGKLVNLNEKAEYESIVNEFCFGDVLFGKLRPYLAKVVLPEFDGVCTGEMLVLRPNKNKILKEFLFYRLISRAFIDVVNYSTYGAKMPRASWGFIGNLPIGFPELEEQKAIVTYLKSEGQKIATAIGKIEQSITLLQEYKTSLVSSVVTGKMKVTYEN